MALDLLSLEFEEAVKEAVLQARTEALAEGHSLISTDQCGCVVEELPDGRKFEVRFRPGAPAASHVERIREIPSSI